MNDQATTIPATNTKANAGKMAAMQEQMAKMRKEMASMTAEEVKVVLDRATRKAPESPNNELPTPVSNYLGAKLASAMFMALRDELVSAYMRNEAVQEDKAILLQRKEENTFRSDTEAAAAERTLTYYEQLEERVEEIESLIADVVHFHDLAVIEQHREDEARQQDVPTTERTYVTMPSLRWVSSTDKQAHGDKADDLNDMERLTKQCEFWLQYNS